MLSKFSEWNKWWWWWWRRWRWWCDRLWRKSLVVVPLWLPLATLPRSRTLTNSSDSACLFMLSVFSYAKHLQDGSANMGRCRFLMDQFLKLRMEVCKLARKYAYQHANMQMNVWICNWECKYANLHENMQICMWICKWTCKYANERSCFTQQFMCIYFSSA